MPKIVINEYDGTVAGVGEYANFSVVVPGYLSDKADETVFDENGIYECSSQNDFVTNIGKRAAEIVTRTGTAGTGPVVDLTIRYKENATEEELAGIVDNGKIIEIYYKDRPKFEAAFVELCNNNFTHKVGKETKLELTSADYKLYTGVANTTKKPVGELVANDMIYSEVVRTESEAAAVPTVVDDNDGMGTMEIKGVVDATEDVYFRRLEIDPNMQANSLKKQQRRALVELLKGFSVEITGKRPVAEAIITSGGIKVSEIDPKTMESKIVPGLYFAGEIIDCDAYTGGFNLQIAWATAYAAGCSVKNP